MIRPFTLLTAALAIGSGYYLYQAKHRTKLLDERIAAVEQETANAQTRIAVLRAEWALENSPSRLADLAARYLLLAPMQPNQAVSLADLSAHLPPPAEPGAVPGVAQPDLVARAALSQPGLYASLNYFAPSGSAEAYPPSVPVAVAALPAPSPLQATASPGAAAPEQPSSTAAVSVSPPAAPVPASTPAQPPLRAARPALLASVPAVTLPSPARPRAVSVLTSALGGAYPNLPPPAPLSGSR